MAPLVRFLRLTRFLPVWRALVVAGALGLVVAVLPTRHTSTAGGAASPTAPLSASFGPPRDRPGGRFGRPPHLPGRPVPRIGVAPAGAPANAPTPKTGRGA